MPLLVDPTLDLGDRLRIVCPALPELCVERSVGPDGTIDLPLVGAVAAALRHPSEIARDVAARLDEGRILPRVEVTFIGHAADEVSIAGAVARPLRLYAPQGIGRERLLRAADPTRGADLGLLGSPARIRAGTSLDVRVVAADRQIAVVGGVSKPQTFGPSEARSLADALSAAGGLTAHADPESIVVVRGGESIPVALPADAGFKLLPGDVVRVGLVADRRYVLVRGLVAHPGAVEYASGMTATRAFGAAGGLLAAANGGTLVWRTGTKTFRLSLPFLLNRRIPDPVLSPSDSLDVEAGRP